MKVWMVGAGPGDPDLLTVKARRLLEEAKVVVFAGSLVPAGITDLIAPSAVKLDSAAMDLEQICGVYEKAAMEGTDVVRLHSGDPSIFGAIGEQIDWLRESGIEFEVVPGVSSFLSAAAAIDCELTVPEISQTVILTRMAGRTPVPEEQSLERLCASKATVCLFLSIAMVDEAVELMFLGYGGDVPAAVVEKASRPEQRIISGMLSDMPRLVGEAGIRSTALLIAGPALENQGRRSLLYDSAFGHGYREGKK